MDKQKSYIRHWLSPGEPFFEEAIEAIGFALNKGYSLIVVRRLFGMPKARHLYNVARHESLIDSMPMRKIRHEVIKDEFQKALVKVDLRFQRWCNARNPALDPVVTAKMLSVPLCETSPDSVRAHNALFDDFPSVYQKIYKTSITRPPLYDEHLEPNPRLTFIITPGEEEYIASTKEYGKKYMASDIAPEKALIKLKNVLGVRNGIDKLLKLRDRTVRLEDE